MSLNEHPTFSAHIGAEHTSVTESGWVERDHPSHRFGEPIILGHADELDDAA